MYRLVYFGLPGAFSTVPLKALCHAGYAPTLVVQGTEPVKGALRAPVEVLRARPGLIQKVQDTFRKKPERPKYQHDLVKTAQELGIDVLSTPNANDSKVLAKLEDVAPDAYVICGFPHLLSRRALAIPSRGGLNLHPGALPEERGAAPLFWALKSGKTEVHWTIHVLDEGEDSGDVVVSGQTDFEPGLLGQEILTRVATSAAPHLVRALRAMMGGDLVRMPQGECEAGRKRRPAFKDGRLDTKLSALQVYTFAAACAETYSLWAECAGDRFFIQRALSYDPEAKPDFEWFLSGDRLMLRCDPGIVELQLKEHGALFSAEYDEETPDPEPSPASAPRA